MMRTVVVYFSRSGGPMYAHECAVLAGVAEAIAQLRHWKFAGCYQPARHDAKRLYFVPHDTLVFDEASELGIEGATDLFGGVVAYPFMKTKAITHPLVNERADRPIGWQPEFALCAKDSVLPGYTVFNAQDARSAAACLLKHGPIRVKDPVASSGKSQTVVSAGGELDETLDTFSEQKIGDHGLVLESDLHDVITRSVGLVTIDDQTIAYHGTQRTSRNNRGERVYAGSDLVCVQGGWKSFDRLPMALDVQLAVAQARRYDEAASEYLGFFGSRRNYDVAQGIDGEGQWRSGVLEASWRSGGASTAELAALTVFARDPALQVVEASAVKEFKKTREVPHGSVIHFQGDDPEDGHIVRYTMVTQALRQSA